MTKLAFSGLGRMGHGMAGRYLDAGFTVAVWNRSKAKAEDLIARGARWALSAADAADGATLHRRRPWSDRKSTRLNSSHQIISYAVFCLKKKKDKQRNQVMP